MTRDIVINGRFLTRRVTGVERYGNEILRYIGCKCQVAKMRAGGPAGHAWEQFILPIKLNEHSILWSPANTGPLIIRDQALTIHDLSPLEHPDWFQKSFAAWYRLFLPILAKRVRTIFVPSEYIKHKVMKHFGIPSVVVTSEGVNGHVFHPDARQDWYSLPQRYILFVGSLEPRKNLGLLLNAWDEIKNEFEDLWLVIAGGKGKIFREVNLPSVERVCFLGYVEDESLPGLYAQATLFVLPSQEEGFGLPALEAMSSGTPVICSDGGALPEIVCSAGMIFSLSNPTGLSDALKECLNNASLRVSLREKGLARAKMFSWQTTAELIWKNLNEI
jgi:glycosyltransferase involved in cell wall biosynthesis